MKLIHRICSSMILAGLCLMPQETKAMQLGRVLVVAGAALILSGAALIYKARYQSVPAVDDLIRRADALVAQPGGADRALLENTRIALHRYAQRTAPDFYEGLVDTFERNVQNLRPPHNDPRHAYESARELLGHDIHGMPSDVVARELNEVTTNDVRSEDDKWIARQLGYIFRDELGRENYDAFLQGQAAADRLRIPVAYQGRLNDRWYRVTERLGGE